MVPCPNADAMCVCLCGLSRVKREVRLVTTIRFHNFQHLLVVELRTLNRENVWTCLPAFCTTVLCWLVEHIYSLHAVLVSLVL